MLNAFGVDACSLLAYPNRSKKILDTLEEGLEIATRASSNLQATALVWLGGLLTLVTLLVVGRRGGRAPEGLALADFIALGIGLHNFGEGLAIGTVLRRGRGSPSVISGAGIRPAQCYRGRRHRFATDARASWDRHLRWAGRGRRLTRGPRHMGRRVRVRSTLGGPMLWNRRRGCSTGGDRSQRPSAPRGAACRWKLDVRDQPARFRHRPCCHVHDSDARATLI